MPFGVSALYAFSVHIPIDNAVNILIAGGILKSTFISNMLIQITVVFLIWFLTVKKVLAPTKETLRYWSLFPFALGALLLIIDYIIHSTILLPYLLRALVYWTTWFPTGLVGF